MTFGERAKTLRLRRGLTLMDMARATGLGFSTISAIENNKQANPTLTTMESIAKGLRMSLAVLLGEDEPLQMDLLDPIPQAVKVFARDPGNVRWIEAAMEWKDSGLSVDLAREALSFAKALTHNVRK